MLRKGDDDFAPAGGSPFTARGDGKLDVVAPNSRPGVRTVTVLLGDGRGGFHPAPHSPFRTAGKINAFFVTVADMNGDHHPDLIVTHDEDSIVTLLLGDGRGDF